MVLDCSQLINRHLSFYGDRKLCRFVIVFVIRFVIRFVIITYCNNN